MTTSIASSGGRWSSHVALNSQALLWFAYAVLIVLPIAVIIAIQDSPAGIVWITFVAYAFALFPTYFLDHWLLGGIGYHSPLVFILLAAMIAALLWPLPALAAVPSLWKSTAWRRTIVAYLSVFAVAWAIAAWQMPLNFALFFG